SASRAGTDGKSALAEDSKIEAKFKAENAAVTRFNGLYLYTDEQVTQADRQATLFVKDKPSSVAGVGKSHLIARDDVPFAPEIAELSVTKAIVRSMKASYYASVCGKE